MMMGILETNRENLLESIRLFREDLDEIERALQTEDYDHLRDVLDAARTQHQKYQ
jgi:prephenate dehydrogenase